MADIYIGNVKGPQGDTGATGPQGAAGDAATIQVGTVSTTAYGNPAQVVNSGTEHAAVFNFTIPQGAPGATVTQLDNLALNTITTSTDQYPQIQVGDLGRVIFGKIIKFFQDLVTGLAAKVNYSDALTMEEIEASSDLTDKVSAAAASKTLKESLPYFTSFEKMSFSVPMDATITPFTAPQDGYYSLTAINHATTGVCFAYILSDTNSSIYIQASHIVTGNYIRTSTGFVALKAGATVYLRANATGEAYVVRGVK